MNGKSLVAAVISEIRGNMTDQEFADALKSFTDGKLDLSRITIQKYRTGQNEPSFDNLQVILNYGKANNLISRTSYQLLADFFTLDHFLNEDTELFDKEKKLYNQLQKKDIRDHHLLNEYVDIRKTRRAINSIVENKLIESEYVQQIPILGHVPAGNPVNAAENFEGHIALPKTFLKSGEYFFLRVSGESMKDVDINDGDLVLVRKEETVDDGQTVVARVNGQDVTVKKFYRTGDKVMLIPANKDFEPISTTDVEIIGVVERVMKNWEA